MKISEITDLGIYEKHITRPQDGFYDAAGNFQSYPEQCPRIVDGELVVVAEDGNMHVLDLVKYRAEKATCEVVFQADGWFWTWEENNAFDGWTSTEDEPSDKDCQFLGEWIKV